MGDFFYCQVVSTYGPKYPFRSYSTGFWSEKSIKYFLKKGLKVFRDVNPTVLEMNE